LQADCVIGVDGNAYSVPWRLIGENVRVVIAGDQLHISHAGREVAVHQRRTGRFQRVVDPLRFDDVVGFGPRVPAQIAPVCDTVAPPELLRPLLEYERLVGGRW